MKPVQVLLRESVPNLGKVGDVVDVSAGYARNYLMPRRMAVAATAENVRSLKRRREALDAQEAALAADVAARVEALAAVRVATEETADDNGHLYGSVNAATIARLLTAAGHATEEKDVRLAEPIKSVGDHVVAIHVHGDATADVTVHVSAKAAEAEA